MPGANTGGFTTNLDSQGTQMPALLGGASGSVSNLTGTGPAGSGSAPGSMGYQSGSPVMFTDSSASGGGLNAAQLQGTLGAAAKIAQPGQQSMGMGRTGAMRSPTAQTFSSGISGTPVVGGSSGVQSLLQLMQQRKG